MISITARNGTHRFQYCAAFPVTVPLCCCCWVDCEAPPRSRTESRQKWIGQKKTIRRWQVLRKFYDDAIEILLKFCGGAIKVL
jgi:hypothetical protein